MSLKSLSPKQEVYLTLRGLTGKLFPESGLHTLKTNNLFLKCLTFKAFLKGWFGSIRLLTTFLMAMKLEYEEDVSAQPREREHPFTYNMTYVTLLMVEKCRALNSVSFDAKTKLPKCFSWVKEVVHISIRLEAHTWLAIA